jgi:hypothetical protein
VKGGLVPETLKKIIAPRYRLRVQRRRGDGRTAILTLGAAAFIVQETHASAVVAAETDRARTVRQRGRTAARGVAAYNFGNLLRRLVLPVAIPN